VKVSILEFELGGDTHICEGESLTLELDKDYEQIEWIDGSTLKTFTTSEQGLITCKVTDYGCSALDELYLEVKPLPYVNLGNDTTLCGDQSLYLNGGDDAMIYNWSTGESSYEIQVFQGYKEISVQVEDEYGCINSDDIIIENCDPSSFFKDIVNAITPSNQDGINDVWEIKELQSYSDAVVDIYDRWGRLIWRSEAGYPTPWDGRTMRGNAVPMDSYHYVIRLNFDDDDRVIGSVTVIR
jgi:gliding motility-associated-like protein